MQISHTLQLESGRGHTSIGRIKAASCWRAPCARSEADRGAALSALIRTAEDYDADAIIGVDFEVDGMNCSDIDGVCLERIAATGIAVKFDAI
jgi:uncharacterized protein YbjQ (UPF0145 family)